MTFEEKIKNIRSAIGIPIFIFITIAIVIAFFNEGFEENRLSFLFTIIFIIILGIIQILFFKNSLKPKKRRKDESYTNISDYEPLEPK